MVLSQKIVATFSRLLQEMTTAQLTPGEYYRLLYDANVPAKLLDVVGVQLGFDPPVLVRSLHEGTAVAAVLRSRTSDFELETDEETEIGDRYLLVFLAVTLSWYERKAQSGFLYAPDVLELKEALKEDGFYFSGGQMFTGKGEVVRASLLPALASERSA